MSINLQFLPNVIAGVSLKWPPVPQSDHCLQREVLVQIGGSRRFADELADDYAIGSAVRALGRKVVVSRFTVGHVCFERGFRALWGRQLRAARTIQAIDPVGYAGTIFFTHPIALSVVAAILGVADRFGSSAPWIRRGRLGDRAGVCAAASSLRVDSRAGRNCICNLSDELFRQKGRMAR
jgi:ceramide glucosyltransferase